MWMRLATLFHLATMLVSLLMGWGTDYVMFFGFLFLGSILMGNDHG